AAGRRRPHHRPRCAGRPAAHGHGTQPGAARPLPGALQAGPAALWAGPRCHAGQHAGGAGRADRRSRPRARPVRARRPHRQRRDGDGAARGPVVPEAGAGAAGGPARYGGGTGAPGIMRRMPDQTDLPFPSAERDPAQGGTPVPPRPPRRPARRRPWWARLLGRVLSPWIELSIEPRDLADHLPGVEGEVCYVLEDYGLSNILILDRACHDAGLPAPLQALPGELLGRRSYLALSRRNVSTLAPLQQSLGRPPASRTHSASLATLLEAHRADPSLDVQLVPVSIFVGRAPDKNSGWFSVLFSENWALVGRFRRLLAIALNGRDTTVRFAQPI